MLIITTIYSLRDRTIVPEKEGGGNGDLIINSPLVQAARTLLTMDETDPKRLFEGEALLRRMYKYGLLNEGQTKLY